MTVAIEWNPQSSVIGLPSRLLHKVLYLQYLPYLPRHYPFEMRATRPIYHTTPHLIRILQPSAHHASSLQGQLRYMRTFVKTRSKCIPVGGILDTMLFHSIHTVALDHSIGRTVHWFCSTWVFVLSNSNKFSRVLDSPIRPGRTRVYNPRSIAWLIKNLAYAL